MPYVWRGNKRLYRAPSRNESHVEPGDEFEPTEAELETFSRYIKEVEPEEPDANPTPEAEETHSGKPTEDKRDAYDLTAGEKYPKEVLEEAEYGTLRDMAVEADTEEINGRSSRDDIVAYFAE